MWDFWACFGDQGIEESCCGGGTVTVDRITGQAIVRVRILIHARHTSIRVVLFVLPPALPHSPSSGMGEMDGM